MPSILRADPRQTLFCHALVSAVTDPRHAVISFGARLLALHLAALGGGR